MKLEIKAQIRKFSALTGHLPLYVDGHQHVHILAGEFTILIAIHILCENFKKNQKAFLHKDTRTIVGELLSGTSLINHQVAGLFLRLYNRFAGEL